MKFYLLLLLTLATVGIQAAEIRHRFIAKDESRAQLHYVNQFDPAQDWTIPLPKGCRDIQLIAKNRILVSHPRGYLEYDLHTRKLLKEVYPQGCEQIESVVRLPSGNTVLAGRKGHITFYELDNKDQIKRRVDFDALKNLRLFRFSAEGHFLFGADQGRMIEADWSGKIHADIKIPGAKHVYWVQKKDGGEFYRVSTGYGKSIVDVSPDGVVLRKLGGAADYFFFSRPFELANGNIVASHWTGHSPKDSRKGPQLLEFNPAGELVWSWHDPERAGTIHGVIILDDDHKKTSSRKAGRR